MHKRTRKPRGMQLNLTLAVHRQVSILAMLNANVVDLDCTLHHPISTALIPAMRTSQTLASCSLKRIVLLPKMVDRRGRYILLDSQQTC